MGLVAASKSTHILCSLIKISTVFNCLFVLILSFSQSMLQPTLFLFCCYCCCFINQRYFIGWFLSLIFSSSFLYWDFIGCPIINLCTETFRLFLNSKLLGMEPPGFTLYQRRAEKDWLMTWKTLVPHTHQPCSWCHRHLCHTQQPCLWRHRHSLPDTKNSIQGLVLCFHHLQSNCQISIFNKQDHIINQLKSWCESIERACITFFARSPSRL